MTLECKLHMPVRKILILQEFCPDFDIVYRKMRLPFWEPHSTKEVKGYGELYGWRFDS